MDNKPAPSVEETMSTSGIPKDAMTAGHTKGVTEKQGRIIPEDAVNDAMIVKDTSKDGIMCFKDVTKNVMTAKATAEGEGTLAFIDVRKNAMAAKVVSEEGAQSQPSSGRPKTGLHLFFMNIRDVFKCDSLGSEIARIAIPAALAFAADPLASLVDTAFIGRIDPVKTEKSTNSFTSRRKRRYIPSVSSALVVGAILGFLQATLLVFGGKIALRIMGVTSDSPMLPPAHNYLTIRSLGAPAVLLSLAVQGVFRGFKDTKTPLFATGVLLLARVISATVCVTLAAALAVRSGPISMAAFQICLQLWLATSLLADGLAVAGQAILATAFAKGDHHKVATAASRVLQF